MAHQTKKLFLTLLLTSLWSPTPVPSAISSECVYGPLQCHSSCSTVWEPSSLGAELVSQMHHVPIWNRIDPTNPIAGSLQTLWRAEVVSDCKRQGKGRLRTTSHSWMIQKMLWLPRGVFQDRLLRLNGCKCIWWRSWISPGLLEKPIWPFLNLSEPADCSEWCPNQQTGLCWSYLCLTSKLESDKFPGVITPCSLANIICPRFVLVLKVFLAQDWVQSGLRFSFVHYAAIAMQTGAAPDFPSLTKAGCLFHYNLNTP